MESCCEANPTEGLGERTCPGCGRRGKSVDLVTLKALLRPEALAELGRGTHLFCASPECPVVYFGAAEIFRREDVLVPVFQKEPRGRRTVCYCFDVPEDRIVGEIEIEGASASAERIRALVRGDRCACELRNPQGGCCLGNIASLVRSLERAGVT